MKSIKKVVLTILVIGLLIVSKVSFAHVHEQAPAPCPLPADLDVYLNLVWPLLDANKDGLLSMNELKVIVPSQYWQYLPLLFRNADSNGDGALDINEIQPIIAMINSYYPGGFVSLIDKNSDGVIQYEEVSSYVDMQTFNLLDKNRNGVIDCGDLGEEPPIPREGEPEEGEIIIEGEYTPPETDPCDWVQLTLQEFANLDQNNDGVITKDEFGFPIIAIYPPPVNFDVVFNAFDLDDNGAISQDELNTWAQMCELPGGGDNGQCPLPADAKSILEALYPLVDLNGDGKLSKDEVRAIYPEIETLLSQYQLSLDLIYTMVDTNGDGGISIDELVAILTSLAPQLGIDPNNLLALIDSNGDLMLSYDEVSQYLTPEQFAYIDVNGNEIIDCNDINSITLPPIDWEGELPPIEGELPPIELDPCQIGPIILEYFSMIDANSDGKITIEDLNNILTVQLPIPIDPELLQELFRMFDIDADSAITPEEIQSILDSLCNVVEGEPLPLEGEFNPPTDPCTVAPFVLQYFTNLDTNGDGGITLDEVLSIILPMTGQMPSIYPLPFPIDPTLIGKLFAELDLNSDGAITREELKTIIQNCAGVPIEGEPVPIEGEIEIPPIWDPCKLVVYALNLFDQIDADGDGSISVSDIIAIMSNYYSSVVGSNEILQTVFAMFDLDENGLITREEVESIAERCGQILPHYEPSSEGEENQPQDTLLLERQIFGNGRYIPGTALTVKLTIKNPSKISVSALGLNETLPEGWQLQTVISNSGATVSPEPGATGTLQFAWVDIPLFPVSVTYVVSVPQDADGPVVFTGQVLYRTPTSEELSSPLWKPWSRKDGNLNIFTLPIRIETGLSLCLRC